MSGQAAREKLGVYELYRFDHGDGTSKDWAIAIIDGQVDTRYGKTGDRLQGGPPKPRFTDVHAELNRRLSEKTRKGYRRIGTVVVYTDGSWAEQASVEPDAAPATGKPSKDDDTTVYFEIHVRNEGMFPEFLRACRHACDILEAAGVTVERKLNEEFNFEFRIGRWGFEAGEGVRAGARNTIPAATRQGAGNVKQKDGVYPLLFLLYLKRSSPAEVGLAWRDGIEVTEKLHHEQDVIEMLGADLDSIRPLAVTLGLAEEKVELATAGGESSLFF